MHQGHVHTLLAANTCFGLFAAGPSGSTQHSPPVEMLCYSLQLP
jgi:hypothetical protein